MSRGSQRLTLKRWLLVCLLIVCPLNFYYFSEQRRPLGSESFWVHGASVGAIVAFFLGLVNVVRARRHARANPGLGRVGFWRVVRDRWRWCLVLLPLLPQFRWTTSSWSRINGSPRYGETTAWGWGGPGSTLFALAVAFALLAILWRQEREARAD